VNSTGNEQDASTGDTKCDTDLVTAGDQCTLRAAIEQANNDTAKDTINFNIPQNDPGFDGPGADLCTNSVDDEGDGYINDGCPQVGVVAESGAQCLNAVNDDPGDDAVVNDGCPERSTGSFTIQPLSPLPVISNPLIIDGGSQPEFVDIPVIALNGVLAGALVDGLRITAGTSEVRGLVIYKFGQTNGADGIEIQGPGGGNIIEGNFIGVDPTGTVTNPDPLGSGDEFGNSGSGIFINGSFNNIIGGSRSNESCMGATNPCNILSGGGRGLTQFNDAHGVEISGAGATGNVVQGNIIGLDLGGRESGFFCTGNADDDADFAVNDGCPQVGATAESGSQCANNINDDPGDDSVVNDGCPAVLGARKDLGNQGDGVNISVVSNNTIGGTAVGAGNVITANNGYGVRITGGASGNHLEGNYIGTTSTGLSIPPPPASKSIFGVLIDGSPNNFIGGSAGGAGNLVSGNLTGVQVQGASSTGNLLRGNYIGTDVNGGTDLGNIGSGMVIASSASNNTIGGTVAGAGNVISGNDNHGLEINSGGSTGNQVQGNFIGTNPAGTGEVGNGLVGGASTGRGIKINGAPGNTIGGTSAGRNVISGNVKYGIEIVGNGATGTVVQSNYIGTDATAMAFLGNRDAGLVVAAPNTVIGGTTSDVRNVISGNGHWRAQLFAAAGIALTTDASSGAVATGTQVQGNFIGTNVAGTAALSNGGIGVVIIDGLNNTVGGTTAGARNIISGNGIHGVEIDDTATGNLVRGNYVGLNVNGNAAVANSGNGVLISDAAGNSVGGTAAGAGNIISANGSMGVEILGIAAASNSVQGNLIGTDAGGGVDLGNAQHGVFVNGAPNNTIGGTTTAARNVISGNGTGVFIQNGGATGNLVQGNRIGTNAAGTSALGNSFDGVRIGGNATNNGVGGSAAGSGNTIAYNGGNGVVVDSGTGNSIRSNSIHTSTSLGIDLGLDGVSSNDAGDGDTGANNLQNYPVIASATGSLLTTKVTGSFNSAAGTGFTLQFFASAACDPSSFGEGATFLGSFGVTTDGSGNASFTNQALPTGGTGGQFITATATDPGGNTSEFSLCALAATNPDSDGDGVNDVIDNCPLIANPSQTNTDGVGDGGDACDLDDDNDGVYDVAEQNCGGNPLNAGIRPERTDLAGDQNGDGLPSEPLPPGSQNYDCDGDGFIGSREAQIGTNDQDSCGANGWPADFDNNNSLGLPDLASFVAPTRHLGTSPGEPGYSARWDIVPGSTFGAAINIQDLAALITGPTGYPPMFGGTRAFGQTCPWPQ
jgi:hypothetical protein